MDEDGLPIVGTGIDFTKVKPLDQKRLLAFVNHFVTHTVRFLNRFAGVCEEKMCHMDCQLQRLEVTMTILETKLASIPGLDSITVSSTSSEATASTNNNAATPSATETVADTRSQTSANVPQQEQTAPTVTEEPPEPEQNYVKVSQDPRYAKYFKMLNFGVPPAGVKTKMMAEGFDPDFLDTPDAPAPPNNEPADSGSEEDSFSDDFSD